MTIQDDINAFNASSTPACLLVLAAQTNQDSANRTIAVATVNDLPDLSLNTIMPGTVLWVDSLNIPVVAQVGCWTGLDDREVRSDCLVGEVWSWGYNAGRLGDNTVTNRSSPVSVVGGFTNWCQIDVAGTTTAALQTNGTAWTWGSNTFNQLGDGTTITRSSPVSVVGGFTDWCQIKGGTFFRVALRTGGSAWAWGDNGNGSLGDNTTTRRSSPVSVVGGISDWCQISAGNSFVVALRSSCAIWGWGRNNCGQLGDNTTVLSRLSPVSVVGNISDWCQVSGGGYHSVAVTAGGIAWAWGTNSGGQLGDNTTTTIIRSPVSVVGGFSDWCQVSGGGYHSVAVRTGGSAWAWGTNTCGRLGDGTTTSRRSPVSVVGGFTDWCRVSGGGCHTVAMRTNGSAWAWGDNTCGRLGDNTVTNRSSPVSVVGGISDWCQVSAGGGHTSALRQF